MSEQLCAVAIMAKASIAGTVKTRLVPPLTHQEAAELNTCCLADIAANITGYAIGYVWSFWLNRRWTFGHQGDVRGSMFRYAMVCLASYAVNLLVLLAAGLYLGQRSLMAQGLGMLSYTLLCYTGSRIFAFPVQPAEGAKR